MEQIAVPIPTGAPAEKVAATVERIALEMGLVVRIRRALKQYPDGRHWHLGKPDQRGTLEVTHWPRTDDLWLSIHANRRAPWVSDTAPLFSQELRRALIADA
jgi:hypothetical protein